MNLFQELERLTSELSEYIPKSVVSANEMRFSLFKREGQDRRNDCFLLWRILQEWRRRRYEGVRIERSRSSGFIGRF